MISVIVPVYKVENVVENCIKSMLSQTFSEFELILIDDGSPDSSGKICDEWAKKDGRIKVIHQKNGGQCAARNAGLEIAMGDRIMFLDSDDCVRNNILEKLSAVMDDTGADLVRCGYVKFKSYGEEIPKDPEETGNVSVFTCGEAFENMTLGKFSNRKPFPPIVWAALYKKEVLDGVTFPEGKIYEEGFVLPHIFLKCEKLAFLDECLYLYYENTDGTMAKKLTRQGLLSLDDWREIHFLIFDKFPHLREATAERWIGRYFSTYKELLSRGDIDEDGKYKKYIKDELKKYQEHFEKYAEKSTFNKVKAFNKGERAYKNHLKKQDFILKVRAKLGAKEKEC